MVISRAISRNISLVSVSFIVFIRVVIGTVNMGFIGRINLLIIRERSMVFEFISFSLMFS